MNKCNRLTINKSDNLFISNVYNLFVKDKYLNDGNKSIKLTNIKPSTYSLYISSKSKSFLLSDSAEYENKYDNIVEYTLKSDIGYVYSSNYSFENIYNDSGSNSGCIEKRTNNISTDDRENNNNNYSGNKGTDESRDIEQSKSNNRYDIKYRIKTLDSDNDSFIYCTDRSAAKEYFLKRHDDEYIIPEIDNIMSNEMYNSKDYTYRNIKRCRNKNYTRNKSYIKNDNLYYNNFINQLNRFSINKDECIILTKIDKLLYMKNVVIEKCFKEFKNCIYTIKLLKNVSADIVSYPNTVAVAAARTVEQPSTSSSLSTKSIIITADNDDYHNDDDGNYENLGYILTGTFVRPKNIPDTTGIALLRNENKECFSIFIGSYLNDRFKDFSLEDILSNHDHYEGVVKYSDF